MDGLAKKSIIFIGLLFCVHVGAAENKSCLDKVKANSVIENFQWWDSKNTPISDFAHDLCDSKSVVYKVIHALIALNDLPPLNDKKDELNANIINLPPFDFFKQRIGHIFFSNQNATHCVSGTTLAYVIMKTSAVHICPMIINSSLTEIMKVLIHESRHAEGFGHVLCDHGDQSNSNIYACDQSYESRGSYGVDTEFQIRLARTPAVPSEIRIEARAGAIARLLNRFNKYPAGIKEGIFGETEDGRLLFVNEDMVATVSEKVKDAKLINFNGVPGWYYKSSSQIFMPNYSNSFITTKGTIINHITEVLNKSRGDLKDYYFNMRDKYFCILHLNSLTCSIFLTNEVRKVSYILPGQSQSFLYLKNMVGIRLQDDHIVALPQYVDLLRTEDQTKLSALENLKSSFQNVVTLEGGEISYNLDPLGILQMQRNSTTDTLPVAKDLRFKKIIGPFMWSERFESIK
ncbi:MAG: hypothetical protein A4S09_10230 [Proteobacteria bacterium SG_bin7]|nr:MAG: hypothetical protein A4S09_10230 [Proteobacteria bacterium SG_bin7]